MSRIDIGAITIIALVLLVLGVGITTSFNADQNICEREFPEVPTWECNFSSKYTVIKMRDGQVTDIPAGFERVEND